MDSVDLIGPAIWGFLVGFVGWESSLRLVEPVTRWVLGSAPGTAASQTIGRLLVVVFLLWSVLLVLLLVPLYLVALRETPVSNADWRNVFGAAVISSLLGAAVLGLLKRASDAGE